MNFKNNQFFFKEKEKQNLSFNKIISVIYVGGIKLKLHQLLRQLSKSLTISKLSLIEVYSRSSNGRFTICDNFSLIDKYRWVICNKTQLSTLPRSSNLLNNWSSVAVKRFNCCRQFSLRSKVHGILSAHVGTCLLPSNILKTWNLQNYKSQSSSLTIPNQS